MHCYAAVLRGLFNACSVMQRFVKTREADEIVYVQLAVRYMHLCTWPQKKPRSKVLLKPF